MTRLNHTILSAFILFIFPAVLICQKLPSVTNLPSKYPPVVPAELKVACLIDPNTLDMNTTCPVIMWNGYVYWVYSFLDNRDAMSIVAYTENGNFVKRWDFNGARYIVSITVDEKMQTISQLGQSSRTITVQWNDLYLPESPKVVRVASGFHPKMPAGLQTACIQSADIVGNMDTCSVLRWKNYTYYAYSFIDNRMAMNIVAYNAQGTIVQQWEMPGAQFLYNITVDPVEQTVTFWGQKDSTIVVPWSTLMIQ